MTQAFLGYARHDGKVGVRNPRAGRAHRHLRRGGRRSDRGVDRPIGAALPHLAGCGQLGPDLHSPRHARRYTRHPNVRRVIVVALGCEQVVAQYLAIPRGRRARRRTSCRFRGRRYGARHHPAASRIARALAAEPRRVERVLVSGLGAGAVVKCAARTTPRGSRPIRCRRVADMLSTWAAPSCSGRSPRSWREHLLAARASRRRPPRASSPRRQPRRSGGDGARLDSGHQPSPGTIRGG